MVQEWLRCAPALVYLLFVGGLVDRYGGIQFLFILPIIGRLLGCISELINYAFIDTLPLEFFYAKDALWGLLGAESIYYLGYYGYGAVVSSVEERPRQLARYSGSDKVNCP